MVTAGQVGLDAGDRRVETLVGLAGALHHAPDRGVFRAVAGEPFAEAAGRGIAAAGVGLPREDVRGRALDGLVVVAAEAFLLRLEFDGVGEIFLLQLAHGGEEALVGLVPLGHLTLEFFHGEHLAAGRLFAEGGDAPGVGFLRRVVVLVLARTVLAREVGRKQRALELEARIKQLRDAGKRAAAQLADVATHALGRKIADQGNDERDRSDHPKGEQQPDTQAQVFHGKDTKAFPVHRSPSGGAVSFSAVLTERHKPAYRRDAGVSVAPRAAVAPVWGFRAEPLRPLP